MIDTLEKLRALLWERWDPIGVNVNEKAKDEYDRYALHVGTLLASGASVQEISDYLAQVETEWMGLPLSDIHTPVAEEAMRIYESSSSS